LYDGMYECVLNIIQRQWSYYNIFFFSPRISPLPRPHVEAESHTLIYYNQRYHTVVIIVVLLACVSGCIRYLFAIVLVSCLYFNKFVMCIYFTFLCVVVMIIIIIVIV
jgi:hypothetical protein